MKSECTRDMKLKYYADCKEKTNNFFRKISHLDILKFYDLKNKQKKLNRC